MKSEDIQDAVPDKPEQVKHEGPFHREAGNIAIVTGLATLFAPHITRDLLWLPQDTPGLAMAYISGGMIANGILLHLTQKGSGK